MHGRLVRALPKHAPHKLDLMVELIPSFFNASPDLSRMGAVKLKLVDGDGSDQTQDGQRQKSAHCEKPSLILQLCYR